MRKFVFAAIAAGFVSTFASADVTVKFPDTQKDSVFIVEHMLVSDMVRKGGERPQPVIDTLKSVGGVLKFELDEAGAANYRIPYNNGRSRVSLYASPGENLAVIISSKDPLKYEVVGTKLMEGMTDLMNKSSVILDSYRAAAQSQPRNEAAMEKARQDYDNLFVNYIKSNPSEPAALFALLNLNGENFMNGFESIDASLKNGILYPLVLNQKEYEEKSIAAERKMQELQSGNVMAPDFTLKNLEGKDVKLSDFRGKWVIIDFWGSWCGWCIKGFPKLKDAYEQYKPELEILGVDCNEPEANWRKGVEKYKLPWVNVYNPEGTSILSDYAVQGFPTKAIISPEGKIANITVGEDPSFFDTLAKLINGK